MRKSEPVPAYNSACNEILPPLFSQCCKRQMRFDVYIGIIISRKSGSVVLTSVLYKASETIFFFFVYVVGCGRRAIQRQTKSKAGFIVIVLTFVSKVAFEDFQNNSSKLLNRTCVESCESLTMWALTPSNGLPNQPIWCNQ